MKMLDVEVCDQFLRSLTFDKASKVCQVFLMLTLDVWSRRFPLSEGAAQRKVRKEGSGVQNGSCGG